MMPKLALLAALLAMVLVAGGAQGVHPVAPTVREHVALDSDALRAALLTFPPGSSSGLHLNPEPEIGIVVEGELTLITRRGKEVLKPGAVVYLEPITGHDARNEGRRPLKLWALNLKKCE
jgi:quercetin dioxygenase-like cupin family protein